MKKIYGKLEDWNNKNWKKSFKDLANDGYSFEKIQLENWYINIAEGWKISVLVNTNANKIIKETEKAVQYSVVTQYGNMYEIWFPKKAIIK